MSDHPLFPREELIDHSLHYDDCFILPLGPGEVLIINVRGMGKYRPPILSYLLWSKKFLHPVCSEAGSTLVAAAFHTFPTFPPCPTIASGTINCK